MDCRLVRHNKNLPLYHIEVHTCGNQSELVLLIRDLFLFNISSREEKSHHPLEELVHQLDGERHHIHLMMGGKKILNKPQLKGFCE